MAGCAGGGGWGVSGLRGGVERGLSGLRLFQLRD